MKETVFPDVTTILFVCGESSIDVIGPGKVRLVVRLRVRRSHHLPKPRRSQHRENVYLTAHEGILLDQPVLAR